MFPATAMSIQEEDKHPHSDANTTSSWLGAGVYVPPKNFPELTQKDDGESKRRGSNASRASRGSRGSRKSKSSKASRAIKDNNSAAGGADMSGDDGFDEIKFIGGPKTKALVLTTPDRKIKKRSSTKSNSSPMSPMEEQLKAFHDSFSQTLFGCQEDFTSNPQQTAKKNTRRYQRNSGHLSPRKSRNDKLAPSSNVSMFHAFGTACACIAENNTQGFARMLSGQSVYEEKKDDESSRVGEAKKKKPKKPKNKPKRISGGPVTKSPALIPMDELMISEASPIEVSRGISELTMRSSYARAHAPVAAQRRMAYYAVGKHNKQNARGGNRRCYYSGKLIVGDNPFYAGCVKQGVRTLVVFCLPSALGLPKTPEPIKPERKPSFVKSFRSRSGLLGRSSSKFSSTNSTASTTSTHDTASSVAVDGEDDDFDINSRLDKDYLLHILPEPKDGLMDLMEEKFPPEYNTLPAQVRTPDCWRLYIQFCFFSGLPIAEGECYYKIRSEISEKDYGESIVLSQEIMEVVSGASSDMVRLPNLKVFQYLKKHYPQQSEKLPASVFERSSWEVVLPEI